MLIPEALPVKRSAMRILPDMALRLRRRTHGSTPGQIPKSGVFHEFLRDLKQRILHPGFPYSYPRRRPPQIIPLHRTSSLYLYNPGTWITIA